MPKRPSSACSTGIEHEIVLADAYAWKGTVFAVGPDIRHVPEIVYPEQGSKCAVAATECQLSNQRDKFLAPEASWRNLADMPTMIGLARAGATIFK